MFKLGLYYTVFYGLICNVIYLVSHLNSNKAEATDLRSALIGTTRRGGESTANKIGNGVVEPSVTILSNPRST
ncbi:hypothetical protein QJS04_geneDACA018551 [Acorus gramineus]|uniref:Uncharacterized protein n=1 Tax=Acorus gramineus TaxID=55184 RepID=A0AAV9BUU9_ACOGR|nr:hypothetical protein QJS04_geneDACA018551 [Acorus gramineus]